MHQGKKGNLILPLWFDSSNCSNDSSVVLWVLCMSLEPVISPVGTRGWERMLLQPTKWPLNHRLWSHSGLWKSVHLLLDVSGACMCVDVALWCQHTLLAAYLYEKLESCLDKNCMDARLHCWSAYSVSKNCMAVYNHWSANCVYTESMDVNEAWALFFVHLFRWERSWQSAWWICRTFWWSIVFLHAV